MRPRFRSALILAACGLTLTLAACSSSKKDSSTTTTTTAASSTTTAGATSTTAAGPKLVKATFAIGSKNYTVLVPTGWTETKQQFATGNGYTWTDPSNSAHTVTVSTRPLGNNWNAAANTWRDDIPGFPGDAKKIGAFQLQTTTTSNGVVTTTRTIADVPAGTIVEVKTTFPVGWESTSSSILDPLGTCLTAGTGC